MARDWETHLERWLAGGLIEPAAAAHIRDWERQNAAPQGLRWPALVALALGALLLGTGALLFVSAHWDQLGPMPRLSLVVGMVALFHCAGAAVAERFPSLSVALHAVGTVALGGGIAVAGQIFHLEEHWPTAVLLWAVGAAAGWALLGHWPQAALTAILGPWWLASEWLVWTPAYDRDVLPVAAGVCALSLVYLSARRGAGDSGVRKALAWIGGIALLPSAFVVVVSAGDGGGGVLPWVVAAGVAMAVSWALRGVDVAWNAAAIGWAGTLAAVSAADSSHIAPYLVCAAGAVGLTFWGVREERAERINLGLAGFALTVFAFYFSTVMDKLGRSVSLISLGLLFLGGGWMVERMRRRLIASMHTEGI